MHSKTNRPCLHHSAKYVNKAGFCRVWCAALMAWKFTSSSKARGFQRTCLPGVPSRPGWLARHKGSAGRSIVSAWLRLSTGQWVAC